MSVDVGTASPACREAVADRWHSWGTLFGASGLSPPITLSFLNTMTLERRQFVATVTMFFTMMGVVQIPMLLAYGIMDGRKFLISAAALLPVVAFMPLGSWLARIMSRDLLDKLILVLLTVITIRLVLQGWNAQSKSRAATPVRRSCVISHGLLKFLEGSMFNLSHPFARDAIFSAQHTQRGRIVLQSPLNENMLLALGELDQTIF